MDALNELAFPRHRLRLFTPCRPSINPSYAPRNLDVCVLAACCCLRCCKSKKPVTGEKFKWPSRFVYTPISKTGAGYDANKPRFLLSYFFALRFLPLT